MPSSITPRELDEILALQLSVAWAGEAAGEPPRLGWWKTDLVDAEGGGDLFSRLAPKTGVWASLALVREAACVIDRAAREKLAHGDAIASLYHFGFAVDEALADRLAFHRQQRHEPSVLGERLKVGGPWSRGSFEGWLGELAPKPKFEIVPNGRRLTASGSLRPSEAAPLLAAALLPLGPSYPLPYLELRA